MFNELTPYRNNKYRLKIFQSAGDIMSGIMSTHNIYASEYDKIAKKFDGGSTHQICKRLYNFLLNNTHYVIEKNNLQTLRSPSAILALGSNPKIGLDCKSYALFIGGVLGALQRSGKNIDWCYRFASYNIADPIPHHVFIVVNPNKSNEFFVDPVIQPMEYKKPYFYKIDKKSNMALYSISGIGARKKNRKSPEQQAKKKANKEKIVKAIKKAGNVVVKYSPVTATGRNAFLLLVKLNVFKLATNLKLAMERDPQGLQNFWKKIGGNFDSLQKNIAIGAKRAETKIASMGEPVTATATTAVVTATPILIAIKEFLQKLGIKPEDLTKFAGKVVESAIDAKAEKMADAETSAESPATEQMATASAPDEDQSTLGVLPAGMKINPMLLIGAGAIAFFLFKRK